MAFYTFIRRILLKAICFVYTLSGKMSGEIDENFEGVTKNKMFRFWQSFLRKAIPPKKVTSLKFWSGKNDDNVVTKFFPA